MIQGLVGFVSIGAGGCVLEVTEMDGNKAIAPPTKSEQNRSRCNCCRHLLALSPSPAPSLFLRYAKVNEESSKQL